MIPDVNWPEQWLFECNLKKISDISKEAQNVVHGCVGFVGVHARFSGITLEDKEANAKICSTSAHHFHKNVAWQACRLDLLSSSVKLRFGDSGARITKSR